MAAELVETSRLFARTVAAIDPAWAEALAGDLAKTQVSEPHWSKDAGAAVAYEKVTLFGVEIVPRRRVQFARIDRAGARELFLRHALVEGEWDPSRLDKPHRLRARQPRAAPPPREDRGARAPPRHPRRRRGGLRLLRRAHPGRRVRRALVRALVAGCRGPHPAAARRCARPTSWPTTPAADERDFPTRWRQGDQTLQLAYRFEPGAPDDGVTVVVPLAAARAAPPRRLRLAGARHARRADHRPAARAAQGDPAHVVPAADWAAKFSEELAGQGPESHDGLPPARAHRCARAPRPAGRESAGDAVRLRARARARPPAPSFRAVDERGRAVGTDRDLAALQERLAARARDSVASSIERAATGDRPGAGIRARPRRRRAAARRERTGHHDVGLRRPAETRRHEGRRRRRARLSRASSTRARASRCASRRHPRPRPGRPARASVASCCWPSPRPPPYVQEHLTSAEKLALAASPYPSARALIEDCRVAVADAVIARTAPTRHRPHAGRLRRVRDAFSAAVVDELFQTVSLTARILTAGARRRARAAGAALADAARRPERRRGPAAGLVFPGFVSRDGARPPRAAAALSRGRARARCRGSPTTPAAIAQRMTEFERAAPRLRRGGRRHPPAPGRAGGARAHALAARGVPREPVRAAPRHRRAGVAASGSRRRSAGIAPPDARGCLTMAHAIAYTEFGGPEVLTYRGPRPVSRRRARSRSASRRPASTPSTGSSARACAPPDPIDEPRRVGRGRRGRRDRRRRGRRRLPPRRRRRRSSARPAPTRPMSSSTARRPTPGPRRCRAAEGAGARHPRRHRLPGSPLARRRAGDTLLVHAGSGSVGQAAIQYAVLWGATVIATSSERRADRVRELGATPVAYGDGLADRVRAAAPQGVTVALDAAGTDEALETSLELVADRDPHRDARARAGCRRLGHPRVLGRQPDPAHPAAAGVARRGRPRVARAPGRRGVLDRARAELRRSPTPPRRIAPSRPAPTARSRSSPSRRPAASAVARHGVAPGRRPGRPGVLDHWLHEPG